MNPDLERLIRLQDLVTAAEHAEHQIAENPERQAALEARLTSKAADVDDAKARLAENQAARRDLEKDLAAVQTRLSNYKNQLMAVKTNKEYQAMQTEIATAEQEVQRLEDMILEQMLGADEVSRAIEEAERELQAEQGAVATERAELDRECEGWQRDLEQSAQEREQLTAAIGPEALALFDHVTRGRGVAMSRAKDGLCSVCHVRLRPQVYNEVLNNESLIQCENCQRILHALPSASAG